MISFLASEAVTRLSSTPIYALQPAQNKCDTIDAAQYDGMMNIKSMVCRPLKAFASRQQESFVL
jgi:hypothetical protein